MSRQSIEELNERNWRNRDKLEDLIELARKSEQWKEVKDNEAQSGISYEGRVPINIMNERGFSNPSERNVTIRLACLGNDETLEFFYAEYYSIAICEGKSVYERYVVSSLDDREPTAYLRDRVRSLHNSIAKKIERKKQEKYKNEKSIM